MARLSWTKSEHPTRLDRAPALPRQEESVKWAGRGRRLVVLVADRGDRSMIGEGFSATGAVAVHAATARSSICCVAGTSTPTLPPAAAISAHGAVRYQAVVGMSCQSTPWSMCRSSNAAVSNSRTM